MMIGNNSNNLCIHLSAVINQIVIKILREIEKFKIFINSNERKKSISGFFLNEFYNVGLKLWKSSMYDMPSGQNSFFYLFF